MAKGTEVEFPASHPAFKQGWRTLRSAWAQSLRRSEESGSITSKEPPRKVEAPASKAETQDK